ncbi:ATP-binding protein [Desulfotignum balticum]|uniref:ATP-binding protein n=1 Tax=Desulfotignum balticum TaxID=115781 RepID=UPI000405D0E6|nr:ATP-binding protein [Desulfotignum balticum]
MKKLPLGIQNFPEIRRDHYVYIDKTPLALKMADSGKYYFLSRPRRFGKSLFLDTLKCLFEAKKELFKGLFVHDRWDWDKTYPVIRIDFSKGLVKTKKEMSDKIGAFIRQSARDFNLEIQETGTSNAFEELIRKCHDRHDMPVVILIDEYDKPILDNITDNDTALIMREGMDPFIRFVFLTGVSKFSKMNLFSGLNNLQDITLSPEYATICGYTQADVEISFKEHLARTGPEGPVDLAELAKWYNGYSFFGEPVYNPYDILLFFQEGGKFKNYWFETGTPTFLMDMIRDKQYFLPDLENLEVSEQLLNTFDVGNIPIESLMFQTGYLTIKKTATIFNQVIHTLSYPNFEVKNAFNQYLIGYFTEHRFQPDARLYKTLLEDDFTGLKAQIARLFAAIPYTAHGNVTHYEGFYVSVIYAFLASLGLDLTAEDITSKGRADLTLKFPGHEKIYIFEFKVVQDEQSKSKNPLVQIKEKRYFEKYMEDGNRIFLIGIEFSKEKRNIVSFEWEPV